MSALSGFFKESHRSMAVFYPVHYLIAVFKDLDTARRVRNKLLTAEGFPMDETIAVEGNALLDLEKEEATVAHVLMEKVSRGFSCEQISTDHILEYAKEGCGLLVVHCPTEPVKLKAWHAIAPDSPRAAHYYDRLGVEDLAGGIDTN